VFQRFETKLRTLLALSQGTIVKQRPPDLREIKAGKGNKKKMADEKIVSNERLHDYLRTYVKTLKLTNPKFVITEGSNVGDNYVSLVCRVTIEGMENGEVKKIELILKTTRSYDTKDVLSSSKVTKLFEREMFFYREVWPIFKETLKERGGIVDRFPVLYDVNVDPGKEVILRFTAAKRDPCR